MGESKMKLQPRGLRLGAIRSLLSRCGATVLFAAFIACIASSADAQDASNPDHVTAGRALALTACTGCHVVLPDQPFRPVFTGPPPPPDFRTIANAPSTSAASLRKVLSSLHTVPPPQQMANPQLTNEQLENVVAFIMTLREAR
jgi:mono/diheme cytochrome c family protein